MFIRLHLGWVIGFPQDANTWVTLPAGAAAGQVALDRDLMRRSTRSLNKLLRDFPRALPRVVGDTARWAESHRALFAALKPAVHGGGPLPLRPLDAHPHAGASLRGRMARLEEAAPGLAPFIRAFVWLGWTDLESLARSLRWLALQQDALLGLGERLGEDAVPLAVRLWQLSEAEGARRVQPVVDFLAEAALWDRPLECDRQFVYLAAAAIGDEKRAAPQWPKPRLPGDIVAWLHWLLEQDKKTRRRALELFDILVQPSLVPEWGRWWTRFEKTYARHRDFPVPRRRKDPIVKDLKRVRERLEAMPRAAPPAVPAKVLIFVLRNLPLPEHAVLHRVVCRALGRWPTSLAGASVRVALARHWMELWLRSDAADRALLVRLIPLVTELGAAKDFRTEVLVPWIPIWKSLQKGKQTGIGFDDDILDLRPSRTQLEAFFRILGAEIEVLVRNRARLALQLSMVLPVERAKLAFAEMKAADFSKLYYVEEALKLATRLTQQQESRFPAIAAALAKAWSRYPDLEEVLKPVIEAFGSINRMDILADVLEAGGFTALLQAGFKRGVILAEKGQVPHPSFVLANEDAVWIVRYPKPLHDGLRALVLADPKAEASARRLLSKDFPDPEGLRKEIAVLRVRPERSPPQEIRLANLEARLKQPKEISPRRLETLAGKIRNAASRTLVEDWLDRLDERYRALLPRYLGVETVPDWLDREDVAVALLPLPGLGAAFRELARRLLRARASPPPWDLRDLPANRKFAEAMRRKGLDLAPWLEEADGEVMATPDGRAMTLRIERDPLEVFHMGRHFSTCLAPGAFNYFSVFANAADINKQVLYARDDSGRPLSMRWPGAWGVSW
jgi:hypothetical protein